MVAVALALGISALAGACGDDGSGSDAAVKEQELAGIERRPVADVSSVTLPDASAESEPFATKADDGSLLLVYFGYTNCPDVCPTTMADVRQARKTLGADGDRVDLAMVTIDPARDTGELLTGYVQTFVPGAHALRTEDPAELQAAAEAFGASYSVGPDAAGDIEVSHTGHLYAVDATGRLLLQWPFGTPAEDLASDLAILLDRQASTSN